MRNAILVRKRAGKKDSEDHIAQAKAEFGRLERLDESAIDNYTLQFSTLFNELSEMGKLYLHKEYLLFSFLKKAGIIWIEDKIQCFLAKIRRNLIVPPDSGVTYFSVKKLILLRSAQEPHYHVP